MSKVPDNYYEVSRADFETLMNVMSEPFSKTPRHERDLKQAEVLDVIDFDVVSPEFHCAYLDLETVLDLKEEGAIDNARALEEYLTCLDDWGELRTLELVRGEDRLFIFLEVEDIAFGCQYAVRGIYLSIFDGHKDLVRRDSLILEGYGESPSNRSIFINQINGPLKTRC